MIVFIHVGMLETMEEILAVNQLLKLQDWVLNSFVMYIPILLLALLLSLMELVIHMQPDVIITHAIQYKIV